jgi:hypothetical protein
MASRALIIAAESYPRAQGGVASSLPGTLQAGLDFKAWLESKWKADGLAESETEIVFCSSPQVSDGLPATAADVTSAIYALKDRGRGMTEKLYVFFSGHGFSFQDRPGSRADVIMTADFVNGKLSGASCFNLDMLVLWFRDHMGPGEHFYFIDACRNNLSSTDVAKPVELVWDRQVSPDASTFTLRSTAPGAVALAQGAFSRTLLDGLKGQGRAKAWEPGVRDRMVVRYDTLRSFVKANVKGTQVSGEGGESDTILATIRPVPTHTCTIEIDGSTAADEGTVMLTRGRSPIGQEQHFTKTPAPLVLEPDDYVVAVRLTGGQLTPDVPQDINAYADQTIRFRKGGAPGLDFPTAPVAPPGPPGGAPGGGPRAIATPAGGSAELEVVVPPSGTVTLRNLSTGSIERFDASKTVRTAPGDYLAILAVNDADVRRRELRLTTGSPVSLDLNDWRQSVPHQSIAAQLPVWNGAPDFSETLNGPVSDPDLDLWLALIGAGRILGSPGNFSKLSRLPLHDFRNERPGASPTYVVGGFADPAAQLQVSVSPGPVPNWQTATEPGSMPGIREAYFPSGRGPKLISFRLRGGASYTVASYSMEHRATLLTVTMGDDGQFRLGQYLLPLGHLEQFLPSQVQERLQGRLALQDVRYLAKATRAFSKRRSIEKETRTSQLMELLYTKWLDPIGSALASYELIRRGQGEDLMNTVVMNMLAYFPELPDTAALAALTGRAVTRPNGPPLFFDGLRAFVDFQHWLPLPAARLDFASTWTAWRGAVK